MRGDIRPKRTVRTAHRLPTLVPPTAPSPPPEPPPVAPSSALGTAPRVNLPTWSRPRLPLPLRAQTYLKRAGLVGASLLALGVVAVRAQGQVTETRGEVTASVTVAQDSLKVAKANLVAGDYAAAQLAFRTARQALHQSNAALAERGQLNGLVGTQGSGTVAAGGQLLASGELMSQSGEKLAADLQAMREDLGKQGNDLYKVGEVVSRHLATLEADLAETESRVTLLDHTVGAARQDIGHGTLKDGVDHLAEAMPELKAGVSDAREVVGALPTLLGHDRFKQYLVWFQNPGELRATGGFVGTYGRLTLDNGTIKELAVDSIYNPANQANAAIKEEAPVPYRRFYGGGGTTIWGMQDANWSPDFPTSARKFQQFYEKGGGPTTDGVIAITVNPVVEILKLVGPVEMPEYDYTLSADNFQLLIQQDQRSRGELGDTDPKRILRDFLPKLLAKIGQTTPAQQQEILKIVGTATKQRDIQATFTDERLQNLATRAKVPGTLIEGANTLSVVDTNIGGYKSSTDIVTSVTQKTVIAPSGEAEVSVTVKRQHTAATSENDNVNFTRLVVPKESKLLSSEGYDPIAAVTAEEADGFMVIGGWTDVPPRGERTVTATYRLPARVALRDGELPLLYQKQPGTNVAYAAEIELPEGYRWTEGTVGRADGRNLRLEQPATTNLEYPLKFEPTDAA